MRRTVVTLACGAALVSGQVAWCQRTGGIMAAAEFVDLRSDPLSDSYNTLYKGPAIKALHPGFGCGLSAGGWLSTNTSGSIGFRSGLAFNITSASYQVSRTNSYYQRLVQYGYDGHITAVSLQLPLLFEAHLHRRLSVFTGITWKQEVYRQGRTLVTVRDSSYGDPVLVDWLYQPVGEVPDRVRYQQDLTLGLEYHTSKGLRVGVFAEHGLRYWKEGKGSGYGTGEPVNITRTAYKVQLAWPLFNAPAASRARRLLRRVGWDGAGNFVPDTVPAWGPYFRNGHFWLEGGGAYTSGAFFNRDWNQSASIDRLLNEPAAGYGMQFAVFFHPDRPRSVRFRFGLRASMRRYAQRVQTLVRGWDPYTGMYAEQSYDGTVSVDDYMVSFPLLFDVRLGARATAFFGTDWRLSDSQMEHERGQMTVTYYSNSAANFGPVPYTLYLGDRARPRVKVCFNAGFRYRLTNRFLVSAEYSAVQSPWVNRQGGGPVNEVMLSGGWILRSGKAEVPKR